MDVIISPTGPLHPECEIVYLWSARELEAVCSAQASHEAPSRGANVIKINSGRPHLMRINAGADESTCPSLTHTHTHTVWVCVLFNLWEHLVHAGFIMNIRKWGKAVKEKKIEGENCISSLARARALFFFPKMALTQYELFMLLWATKTNVPSSFQPI